ncbi:MAG: hypothetical protein JWM20_448 [Patescibacteria group bacterium]|nr:hypothetical protein [Patescibacteria group bacterium]
MERITVSEQIFKNKNFSSFLAGADFIVRRAVYSGKKDEDMLIEKLETYFSSSLGKVDLFDEVPKLELQRNDFSSDPKCIGVIYFSDKKQEVKHEPLELDFGSKLFFNEEERVLRYIGSEDKNNSDVRQLWEIKEKR